MQFEAASVKPIKAQTSSNMHGGPGSNDPERIRYFNVTLADMIEKAYDIKRYQIRGGASWFDSEGFEVLAKVPKGATKDDLKAMLRSLLAEPIQASGTSRYESAPQFQPGGGKGRAEAKPSGGKQKTGPLGNWRSR